MLRMIVINSLLNCLMAVKKAQRNKVNNLRKVKVLLKIAYKIWASTKCKEETKKTLQPT